MSFDVIQKLDKLRLDVDERLFERPEQQVEPWEAFDVLVSSLPNDRTRRWEHTPTQSHDYHHVEARRRAVVTRYAAELSWLFEQLKEIHPGEIERWSDYDFYAVLADEAIHYIDEKKRAATASGLLHAIIDRVVIIYR